MTAAKRQKPEPVDAATVILVRDGAEGLETLMLRRNSKLEFVGGMWVFPGGRLDPEDWEAVRGIGHRMIDDMLQYMRTVGERPAWEHLPDRVKARFTQPLPQASQPLEAVYDEFRESILPYPIGNIHPRFWGWVIGTGDLVGALADAG